MIETRETSFQIAAHTIPAMVPRVHRGREPMSEGLDCWGLVLWLYSEAGHDVSDMDFPYAERDQSNPRMWERARRIVEQRMMDVTQDTIGRRDQDGDVWLYRDVSGGLSIAVCVNREVLYMSDSLRRQSADSLRVYVTQSFRLR